MREAMSQVFSKKSDKVLDMSRQLSRIRSLISEMEEVQKEGQKSAHFTPPPEVPVSKTATFIAPVAEPMPSEASLAKSLEENLAVGKVSIQLTGNVVVQLQIEHTNEVIEVRRLDSSLEIRFADGKAVHLPLKNVA
jgi:hypothetical protein